MSKWIIGTTPVAEIVFSAVVLALFMWALWPRKRAEPKNYGDYLGPWR